MESEILRSLVVRAREGDADAYGVMVRRFQDMAVGYGYSMLGDFHLAQDAAQEAFFEAYRCLANLRDPAAFPGWFRRIVFKQCDRILRRRTLSLVPLDGVRVPPTKRDVSEEMKEKVLEALESLPEHERMAAVLFYISGHSLAEVSDFLEVPVGTVKKRLYSARSRLREMLIDTVEDNLRQSRPSRDPLFAESLLELLKAAAAGDAKTAKQLLERNPRLLAARDPLGNTALIIAVNSGHSELAEMLRAAGVEPDFHEAAAIGDTAGVASALVALPTLLDACSPEGFPAIALAAHFGHTETVNLLIEHGADIDRVATHRLGVTPLHAALFGRQLGVARLLVERGAGVTPRRGGQGLPRSGWTALHYAASFGFTELIPLLLDRGAAIDARDDEGKTAMECAVEANQTDVIELLNKRGG